MPKHRSKKSALPSKNAWAFARRFRRHGFGLRAQPAAKAVREAFAEDRKVAHKDPALAGEGVVMFLKKVSGNIEIVDSSSGALGTAVNNVVEDLARVIAAAPSEDRLRELCWAGSGRRSRTTVSLH